MLYGCTIPFTTLVAFASICSAAPTSSSGPANPISTGGSKSPNDPIYHHLAANSHLNWTSMGGGYGAIVQKEHWEAAKKATGATGHVIQRDLQRRSDGGGHEGQIEGLDTNVFCYGSGTVMQDSSIQKYTVAACDALLGMALPKPAQNALQVWQSTNFADAIGNLGYLRYSFEIFNAISGEPDRSMCQQAMDMFVDFCQSSFGDTQGGENHVGGVYKFSVDPTDDATNA